MKYVDLIALAGCILFLPMLTWAGSFGEGDASEETIAMSAVALSTGPLSVGMAAFNAYRILDHRPSAVGGIIGLAAGGLSMIAGFSLLSENVTYSRLLIATGVGSMLLGGASIAMESHAKSRESKKRAELYPRMSCSRRGALWSGVEFRWSF